MAQSFDDFHAAAMERALAQTVDEHGRPPMIAVTRYSLTFGSVGIPVFGNYHSQDLDISAGRQILAAWLKRHGHEGHFSLKDLPAMWGRWAPDGPQRILDWTVVIDHTRQQPVATRAEAEDNVMAHLEALGLTFEPSSPAPAVP